jgi:phosphatidylglycerol:prolipoprotein diacylglycerol transferase
VHSDIVFTLGPVSVHWYGLLVVVGLLLGGGVASLEARRRGESTGRTWDGLVWAIVPGFLGARLYHVLSSPVNGTGGFSYYVENPIAMFIVWDGGLGIYGAIAGGVLGVLIYAWRNRLNAWRWLDVGAPGLALAQAIGRWTNYLNQELYGPPTRLPWGLYIGANHRIPRYEDLALYPETTRFHPTFFYESLWCLGVFVLLTWGGRRWAGRLRDGDVFLAYLALYAVGRLWIEQFFRPDAWMLDNGLAVGTLVAAGVVLVAGGALWARHQQINGWGNG